MGEGANTAAAKEPSTTAAETGPTAPTLVESSEAITDAIPSPKMMEVDNDKPASEDAAKIPQEQAAGTDTKKDESAAVSALSEPEVDPEPSTEPGKEDLGTAMQVEAEQREHDVNLVPELVGGEAASTRAALGIADPVHGGPPEVG